MLALMGSRLPPAADGVGDHAVMLARALGERGLDVCVLAAGEVRPPSGFRLALVGQAWGPLAVARAVAALRRMRPAALVVEYTPFLYGVRSQAPLAMLAAARVLGIRSALIVHEAFYRAGSAAASSAWKANVLAARDTAALLAADLVVVPSAAREAALLARIPALRGRTAIVPIGANVEPPAGYRRAVRVPQTIVAFGVVMPRRRLEVTLAATASLVASGRDVRLEVVGRIFDANYAAEIERSAARLGIAERVRLRGECSAAEVSATFATAAVAVHAAAEGSVASSGSLLALLAHAVPTVALRTAFDDAVFADGLAFADDEAALAPLIAELIDQPDRALAVGDAGSACYHASFAWAHAAEDLSRSLQIGRTNARFATA